MRLRLHTGSVVVRVRSESGRAAASIAIRYANIAFGDRWSREWPIVERVA